jgi:pyruvate dehydrogenase E1 component
MAVIIHDGMKRMYQNQNNVFYYITAMNENYHHPAMPEGVEDGIIKGMYCLQESKAKGLKVQLMGSGTILREVIAAAELLKQDFAIESDIWSMTSINELAREATDVVRWNQLHPTKKAKKSYVENMLEGRKGPAIIATDYTRTYANQIREHVPMNFVALGTDGFGRSDTRANLRTFFEVNKYYITVATLKALADEGELETKVVQQAIKKYNIDAEKPNPVTV